MQCGIARLSDHSAPHNLEMMVCRHSSVQHGMTPVLVELPPPPEDLWRARIEQRVAGEGGGNAGHKPDWQQLQALIAGCAVFLRAMGLLSAHRSNMHVHGHPNGTSCIRVLV